MERFESDGIHYEAISDTDAQIIGCVTKKLRKLTCVHSVNGYRVTQIARDAFAGHEDLELLYLSPNITKIGGRAFQGCKKLKQICQMSDAQPVFIFEKAFADCTALEHIYADIRSFGMCAFENCVSLKDLVVVPACTHIGPHAFLNCVNLKKINLPGLYVNDPVIYMYDDAFENCTLKYVYSRRNAVIEAASVLDEPSMEKLFPPTATIICDASSNMNEFAFCGYTVMEWKK